MEPGHGKDTAGAVLPSPDTCMDPYLRCAFNGAAQTALGVSGSALLAHSPQGCEYLVNNAFASQECDYMETVTLCTKLCVDEIVHGGEDILARTIREAKDLPVSALFVISACGPEIVGDDIIAVCETLQPEVKFRLVPVPCAGFRGSQYDGIDISLDTILKRLVKNKGEKIPGSVCLIAPHANANPTWTADLQWVHQVLKSLGVRVVATLTHRTPLSEIENAASAETSLVLSHDAGQKAADYLSAAYGIEQVCRGMPLPIGMTNTQRWLMALGERFDAQKTAEEHGCGRRKDGDGDMPAQDADGAVPVPDPCRDRCRCDDRDSAGTVCNRRDGDDTRTRCPVYLPRPVRELLEKELKELGSARTSCTGPDVYKTKMGLREVKPKIIFGSTIERHASEGLPMAYVVEVVRIMRQFRMINREYFGYTGILNLFECVQNEWTMGWRSKEKRYEAKW